MNDDRAFERATEAFLDDGPDRTQSATIEAVLLAVRTTPQERDLRIPWRTHPMSNPMRLIAALMVIVVAGVAAINLLGSSPGVGSLPSPSPTSGSLSSPSATASTIAPTPNAQPSPTALTSGWTTYTSNRYGFSIGYPSNWALRPAVSTWVAPPANALSSRAGLGGAGDPMGTSTEGFTGPGSSILVSAWSVAVAPGTSAVAWIQAYCPKITTACTGIPGRMVAVSMDGQAGSLVRFTDDVEAFVLVNNRMYVVAEWRPDIDQTTSPYGSGTNLVEGYLSTMHLLPGGPAPSGATPRPS